jgi:hypothetical protein
MKPEISTHLGGERPQKAEEMAMRSKAKLTLATLGLGVAVAAGIAGTAFASGTDQPTDPNPTTAVSKSSVTTTTGADAGARPGGARADFEKDLAARLGIPTQKMSDAVKAARAEVRQNGQSLTPAQRADEFANALAGKLGLDPTKVRDAITAVHTQERTERQAQRQARVNQAVQSGKISQADADTYLRVWQTLAQSHDGTRQGARADFEKDLAARLGIPTPKVSDAVKAARAEVHQNGQSLTAAQRANEVANALAGKLGMDPTKVREAVSGIHTKERTERQAQREARVDQAVKSAKISQADADTYLRVGQTLAQTWQG